MKTSDLCRGGAMFRTATLILSAALLSFAGLDKGARARGQDTDRNTGVLKGTVTYAGEDIPKPGMLPIPKDYQKMCGAKEQKAEDLIVCPENKGIKNVVISLLGVRDGRKFPREPEPVVLDQKGCVFVPHVVIVPRKGRLVLKNSDAELHNVNMRARLNRPVNVSILAGQEQEVSFFAPEIIPVKCDVHSWMSAYVVVARDPYTVVTDADGKFSIEGIPPGTYRVKIWHEKLGKVTKEVTIRAGETTELNEKMGK